MGEVRKSLKAISMRIEVGCSLWEFQEYYKRLASDNEWRGTSGFSEELGTRWERVLAAKPELLLVWRENGEIIGHAIWHETSTDEHREGDERDKEDKETLRELCGGKKEDIVELHEVWLRQKYRKKGYGKRFFDFFERFIRKKGYSAIVYYADHPAAVTICRNRGWKEGYLEAENWFVFCLSLSN
jgi:GNAT superfamily N-acetyltransferase